MNSSGLSNLHRPASRVLRIRGFVNCFTGYGLHTQQIVRSFLRFGYNVECIPLNEPGPFPDVAKVLKKDDGICKRELFISMADQSVSPHQWFYTMYETTRLPDEMFKNMQRAHCVIAPCHWNAECWNAQGLLVPIHVVPIGYDPSIYYPAGAPTEICTFGVGGNPSISVAARKNISMILDAFCTAFPSEQDVRLKVKVLGNTQMPLVLDTRIEITKAQLSEKEMGDWMRGLTAFVSASKGEAFGLFNVQAMACGIPVITCAFGGVQDYFDEHVGYPVSFKLCAPKGYYNDTGLWAEPSLKSLIERLRNVYENRLVAVVRGRRSQERVRQYEWDNVNKKLETVLIESGYWEAPPSTFTGSDEDRIIRFYRNAIAKPTKQLDDDDIMDKALSNTPRGLGDTLILTDLPRTGAIQGKPRFIRCNPDEHKHFDTLMEFNPYYVPAFDRELIFADVLQQNNSIGNGHFIQRLQRAFSLEPELKPKPYLCCNSEKVKIPGRVVFHFEAGGLHSGWQKVHVHPRARQLYPESRAILQEFINCHPELEFFQLGNKPIPFQRVQNMPEMSLQESIVFVSTCEWFVGIISGPMHIATAFDLKCVVVINFPPAPLIFLPTLVPIGQVESEWFYPQNVHLHQESDGAQVKRFNLASLEAAFDGKIYPYWDDRFLSLIHERV